MQDNDVVVRTGRRLPWHVVVAPLLVLVALLAWALSSPVGSSPDDDFHLPSIWCGLGDRAGLCESTGDLDTRAVPTPLVGEPCYSRDSSASAACWDPDAAGLKETDRVNVGPLYPPLFYGAMSLFAGPDVVTSVLLMRVFNTLLFTGLVTAAAFATPPALRRLTIVPLVVTMVPLGMFIVPSTNASSWAVLSAGVLWVTLYGAAQTRGRRHLVLLALALFAGILGAGARADAAAFAALAALVVVFLTARRDRGTIDVAVVAGIVIAVSVAFYLMADQSDTLTTGMPSGRPPLTPWQLLDNFLGIPSLWIGMFGGWGLGWLDTPMPAAVSVLAFTVFAMAAALGLRSINLRKGLSVAALFAGLWLVPFILLWQSKALVGTYIQPRYILPLAVLAIGVTLLAVGRSHERLLAPGPAITAIALLSFANTVALHVEITRYTNGLDDRSVLPGSDPEWWWSAGPSAPVVWLVGSVTFAAALIVLYLGERACGRAAALEAAPASADPETDAAAEPEGESAHVGR